MTLDLNSGGHKSQALPVIRYRLLTRTGGRSRRAPLYGQAFFTGNLRSMLRRGETYAWVITAILDGRKVSYPAPSEPENKFSIVSAVVLQELRQIELALGPDSPLALGIIYAREGLISSAEASFLEASKQVKANKGKHETCSQQYVPGVEIWARESLAVDLLITSYSNKRSPVKWMTIPSLFRQLKRGCPQCLRFITPL